MALPPKMRTVPAEVYEEAPEWFGRFVGKLNEFLRDVNSALDRGLTRTENMQGSIVTVRVDTEASVTDNVKPFPLFLPVDFTSPVRSVKVVAAKVLSSDIPFSTAVFPTWDRANDGRVRVRFMTGLSANSSYSFTFELE